MRVLLLVCVVAIAGCTSVAERALDESYGRQDRLESAADMVRAEAHRAAEKGDIKAADRALEELDDIDARLDEIVADRPELVATAAESQRQRFDIWRRLVALSLPAAQLALAAAMSRGV